MPGPDEVPVTGLDALFADAPKTMNPAEVAELLNISRPTVMRYIEQKRLPAYRIGDDGRWFIVRDELKQLMKAHSNIFTSSQEQSPLPGQAPSVPEAAGETGD